MTKFKFVKEYEIRASPKLLFPYISTAEGLASWFAEKAKYDRNTEIFHFEWDATDHPAKLVQQKLNKHARFDFHDTADTDADANYIDFKLETNEITQATFLKISDYSTNTDEAELEGLWDGLVDVLKDLIGG